MTKAAFCGENVGLSEFPSLPQTKLGGAFKYFSFLPLQLGEMIPNLTGPRSAHIFQKWVENHRENAGTLGWHPSCLSPPKKPFKRRYTQQIPT